MIFPAIFCLAQNQYMPPAYQGSPTLQKLQIILLYLQYTLYNPREGSSTWHLEAEPGLTDGGKISGSCQEPPCVWLSISAVITREALQLLGQLARPSSATCGVACFGRRSFNFHVRRVTC